MAFRFPDKDPSEKLDFTVDWSRYLGALTIIDFQWKIIDASGVEYDFNPGNAFENGAVVLATSETTGLENAGQSVTDTEVTIILDKGINNLTYELVCQITTSVSPSTGASIITDRKVKIKVVER